MQRSFRNVIIKNKAIEINMNNVLNIRKGSLENTMKPTVYNPFTI